MSNYYLCDYCANNNGSHSYYKCECGAVNDTVMKKPIGGREKMLDVCLWYMKKKFAKRIWVYGGGGKPRPDEVRNITVSWICGNCRKHVSSEETECKHCGAIFEGEEK